MVILRNSDLRIGNLIASGYSEEIEDTWIIGKVKTILSDEVDYEQIEVETDESFEWFFKDCYFSIPLKKDWLIKFCFYINRTTKEDNNIWRKDWSEGYFELEEIISFFFGYPLYSTEIKTVDHLQNLFYFITKEELKTNEYGR